MVSHCLTAGGVVGQHSRRNDNLFRNERKQLRRNLSFVLEHLSKWRARMPEQGELQSSTKLVPLLAADADDVDVGRLERVEPSQQVSIGRNAEQDFALCFAEQFVLALLHRDSPSTKRQSSLWTGASKETYYVDGIDGATQTRVRPSTNRPVRGRGLCARVRDCSIFLNMPQSTMWYVEKRVD